MWRPCLLILLGTTVLAPPLHAGSFEDLGVPVVKAALLSRTVGPDARGENARVYLAFHQDGAPLFIVQCDPATGEVHQYNAPAGCSGPWAMCAGPDHKLYVGTCEGGSVKGSFLVFDPAKPEAGLQVIGQPSPTDTYLWQFAVGKDKRIYGCTYPQARLVSYDPASGQLADLGRMDDKEMYARYLAAGDDGWMYTGIGMVRANLVAYNPATGEHHGLLPEQQRPAGCGQVYTGLDGNVYGFAGGKTYRLRDGQAAEIEKKDAAGDRLTYLTNGYILGEASLDGYYKLYNPQTRDLKTFPFTYRGAGSDVFVVGEGPQGLIFGGSVVPLQPSEYDPAAGKLANLGNPTSTEGEIYSIQKWREYVYMCAYGGAYLSRYNPALPWNYGHTPEHNPYGIGNVGDGHLRPRAMILGPGDNLYIGSEPPYGQWGGAMAVFDPRTNKVIENYRNLIPDQSVTALAYDEPSGLVFGGSSRYGGGGTEFKAADAHIFAWVSDRKQKVMDLVPVAGETTIASAAALGGKAFFIGRPSNTLTVVDIATLKLVHQDKLTLGPALDTSLGAGPGGLLYGLTTQCVFTIDPTTYTVREFARPPAGLNSGFALTATGLYFGQGVHLWRYKW